MSVLIIGWSSLLGLGAQLRGPRLGLGRLALEPRALGRGLTLLRLGGGREALGFLGPLHGHLVGPLLGGLGLDGGLTLRLTLGARVLGRALLLGGVLLALGGGTGCLALGGGLLDG